MTDPSGEAASGSRDPRLEIAGQMRAINSRKDDRLTHDGSEKMRVSHVEFSGPRIISEQC